MLFIFVANKARAGKIMPTAKNKEENNPEPKKLIRFIKPNQEELKAILEKINEEINVEKD